MSRTTTALAALVVQVGRDVGALGRMIKGSHDDMTALNVPGVTNLIDAVNAIYARPGLQGPPGKPGRAGVDGAPSFIPGPQGPQGIQGIQGVTGPRGAVGASGLTYRGAYSSTTSYVATDYVVYSGKLWFAITNPNVGDLPDTAPTWGLLSLQGSTGAKGDTGAQGIPGIDSTVPGPQGPAGIQGIQGVKGDTGSQGIQGVKGDTGSQGIPGVKGDAGAQGIQGVKGDAGTPGVKGDTGSQGIQGIQGNPGAKGDTGNQGIQGIQGVKGDTGSQGIQGVKGDTGAAGTFTAVYINAHRIVTAGTAAADITVNGTDTPIPFLAVANDSSTYYTLANGKITVLKAGLYAITFRIFYKGNSTAGYRQGAITVNGTTLLASGSYSNDGSGRPSGATHVRLAANDVVALSAYANSTAVCGASTAADTGITITYLGA